MEFKAPKREPEDEPTSNIHTASTHSEPSGDRTNATGLKDATIDFEHSVKIDIDVESRYRENRRVERQSGDIKTEPEEQRDGPNPDDCGLPLKIEINQSKNVESLYGNSKRRRKEEEWEETDQPKKGQRHKKRKTIKSERQKVILPDLKENPPAKRAMISGPALLKSSILTPQEKGPVETCPHCSKCFAAPIKIDDHIRICRSRVKEFPCPKCPSFFTLKRSLNLHESTVHKTPSFKCPECEKVFQSVSNLKVHRRIHSGEKPFKCNKCEKAFSQKESLTYHILIHNGQNPFVCPQCQIGFRTPSHLAKHAKSAHDPSKAQFPCSHCSCAFASKHGVTIHMSKKH